MQNPINYVASVAVSILLLAAVSSTASAQPDSYDRRLDTSGPITFFIAEGDQDSDYRAGDHDLAVWALRAWEKQSGGALEFIEASEDEALVRVFFVPAGYGQYGEMRPILVAGRRGAAVFIRPDTDALGPDIARAAAEDPLLRDSIVYLTCLHELGHAVGLLHTADYEDVMYAFGYGGDIPGFFARYRNQLEKRGDIAAVSGISSGDLSQLRSLYP